MIEKNLSKIAIVLMVVALLPTMLLGYIGFEFLMFSSYPDAREKTMLIQFALGNLNNGLFASMCLVVPVAYSFGMACLLATIKNQSK